MTFIADLPTDLFRPQLNPDEAWRSLEQQGASARAQSIDLIGQLWAEEAAQGEAGWRARVQVRLGLHEEEGKALNTIGDYAKIFRVFRLGGDHGLGWPLSDLERHQPGRLRVFAQNADWARGNPDRVREMLESGRNEGRLRKEVREAIAAEKAGREEDPDAATGPKYKNITLRVTPEDEGLLMAVLDGLQAKLEHQGQTLSEIDSVRAGELILALAGDWFNGASTVERGGKPVLVEHMEWCAKASGETPLPAPNETPSEEAGDDEAPF